jgi:hypothetical protein
MRVILNSTGYLELREGLAIIGSLARLRRRWFFSHYPAKNKTLI